MYFHNWKNVFTLTNKAFLIETIRQQWELGLEHLLVRQGWARLYCLAKAGGMVGKGLSLKMWGLLSDSPEPTLKSPDVVLCSHGPNSQRTKTVRWLATSNKQAYPMGEFWASERCRLKSKNRWLLWKSTFHCPLAPTCIHVHTCTSTYMHQHVHTKNVVKIAYMFNRLWKVKYGPLMLSLSSSSQRLKYNLKIVSPFLLSGRQQLHLPLDPWSS